MQRRKTDDYLIRPFLLIALGSLAVVVISGLLAALVYIRWEPVLRQAGITLSHLRPIHETFALGWVFIAGVTVIHYYLGSTFGPPSTAACRRLKWQAGLWTMAGSGALLAYVTGHFSGREYLGYHPVFSLLILVGWFMFARNYFERMGTSLRSRPVYVYMWTVAIPLFVVTYIESHLYLLDFISSRPVRDIAMQWKSNGVLVGSFNLLTYGSLMYIAGRLRRNDDYAYSRTAFALFFVGVFNTFINYGHHTYHLPQSPWIHWISFSVSMMEIVIVAKLLVDLVGLAGRRKDSQDPGISQLFMRSATAWSLIMVALSIGIAIPPLNALIHGTHVVVAHSMGSMIGINTCILMGAIAFIVSDLKGSDHPVVRSALLKPLLLLFNISFLSLWLAFLGRGIAAGWSRYAGPSAPDFSTVIALFPNVVLAAGAGLTVALLGFIAL